MHTIQAILSSCPHQVSACHQAKALDIDQSLHAGIPFTALGAASACAVVRDCSASSSAVTGACFIKW